MRKGIIDIISMGCSKNLVDSERLAKRVSIKGYKFRHNPEKPAGEYVIVNTCGFIGDAKEESINMILGLARLKAEKKIGKLAVMGCLSQRYLGQLEKEIPEVDLWYGKFDWTKFIDDLPHRENEPADDSKPWERILTTPPWSAYLKISEGCNRHCAYCAIPLITGKHTSRSINEILMETRTLVAKGVSEFNVIAQDLSSYGTDLYGENKLAELIDNMASIDGVKWIRLHYAYPKGFPMEVLDVINRHENVCKYLDVALQHISDGVLANMRRHITKAETIDFIRKVRERMPGIKLRTTMMVGFPGETEEDFAELLEFIGEAKFERLGAFAYSEEEDTWAALNLSDNVLQETKEQRLRILMEKSEEIAYDQAQSMIGSEVEILVETIDGDKAIGRTQWDSPEVDPEFIIDLAGNKGEVTPGNFVTAIVERAEAFELFGRLKNC